MPGQQTINEYGCEVGCTCTVCSIPWARLGPVSMDAYGSVSAPILVTQDQINSLHVRLIEANNRITRLQIGMVFLVLVAAVAVLL